MWIMEWYKFWKSEEKGTNEKKYTLKEYCENLKVAPIPKVEGARPLA